MKTKPVNHPFFNKLPVEWQQKIPIKISLDSTIRHPIAGKRAVKAYNGQDYRVVVDCEGGIFIIPRKNKATGALIPVGKASFRVLEWMDIS